MSAPGPRKVKAFGRSRIQGSCLPKDQPESDPEFLAWQAELESLDAWSHIPQEVLRRARFDVYALEAGVPIRTTISRFEWQGSGVDEIDLEHEIQFGERVAGVLVRSSRGETSPVTPPGFRAVEVLEQMVGRALRGTDFLWPPAIQWLERDAGEDQLLVSEEIVAGAAHERVQLPVDGTPNTFDAASVSGGWAAAAVLDGIMVVVGSVVVPPDRVALARLREPSGYF